MFNATLPLLLKPPDESSRSYVCEDQDWENFEAKLGSRIPEDVKEFNRLYGFGEIGHWMILSVPKDLRRNDWSADQEAAAGIIEIVNSLALVSKPLTAFPEPGGLLVWAMSNNGDTWLWRTDGEPKEWTVVLIPRSPRSQAVYEYPLTATDYLVALISGNLTDDISAECTSTFNLHEFKPFRYGG